MQLAPFLRRPLSLEGAPLGLPRAAKAQHRRGTSPFFLFGVPLGAPVAPCKGGAWRERSEGMGVLETSEASQGIGLLLRAVIGPHLS